MPPLLPFRRVRQQSSAKLGNDLKLFGHVDHEVVSTFRRLRIFLRDRER